MTPDHIRLREICEAALRHEHDDIAELANSCIELLDELDSHAKAGFEMIAELEHYKLENYQLRHDIDRYIAYATELATENERLCEQMILGAMSRDKL